MLLPRFQVLRYLSRLATGMGSSAPLPVVTKNNMTDTDTARVIQKANVSGNCCCPRSSNLQHLFKKRDSLRIPYSSCGHATQLDYIIYRNQCRFWDSSYCNKGMRPITSTCRVGSRRTLTPCQEVQVHISHTHMEA